MEEELGKKVVDGKIIDLDTASVEELQESIKKIDTQIANTHEEILRILGLKNNENKDEMRTREGVEEDER